MLYHIYQFWDILSLYLNSIEKPLLKVHITRWLFWILGRICQQSYKRIFWSFRLLIIITGWSNIYIQVVPSISSPVLFGIWQEIRITCMYRYLFIIQCFVGYFPHGMIKYLQLGCNFCLLTSLSIDWHSESLRFLLCNHLFITLHWPHRQCLKLLVRVHEYSHHEYHISLLYSFMYVYMYWCSKRTTQAWATPCS